MRWEDAARDLRDLREDMDYDGEEAERVESRLDLLRRLNRKYGATTQEMIRYRGQNRGGAERIGGF